MQNAVGKALSLRILFRVLLIYVFSAFLLLSLTSFFLARSDAGSNVLGYVSSAVSFLASFLSTQFLLRYQKSRSILSAMLFGLLLVIILLTIGFLAGEHSLDASGVLSVASFTLTGTMLGGILPLKLLPRRQRSKRRMFSL